MRLAALLPSVHCEPSVRDYIVRLARATREHAAVELGASPRATLALFRASRALAAIARPRLRAARRREAPRAASPRPPHHAQLAVAPARPRRREPRARPARRAAGAGRGMMRGDVAVTWPASPRDRGHCRAQRRARRCWASRWRSRAAARCCGRGTRCDASLYERVVPEDHAFVGETVAVRLRITNRKPLPMPWIEVHEQFPEVLVADAGNAVTGDDRGVPTSPAALNAVSLRWRTSIGMHERVSRDIELQCPARGIYDIGPAQSAIRRCLRPVLRRARRRAAHADHRLPAHGRTSAIWRCRRGGRSASARAACASSKIHLASPACATTAPATRCAASTGTRRRGSASCSRARTNRRHRSTSTWRSTRRRSSRRGRATSPTSSSARSASPRRSRATHTMRGTPSGCSRTAASRRPTTRSASRRTQARAVHPPARSARSRHAVRARPALRDARPRRASPGCRHDDRRRHGDHAGRPRRDDPAAASPRPSGRGADDKREGLG